MGARCRERIEQAKINSGPHRSRYKEFSFDDALADLVQDVLDQLEEHHQKLHQATRSHQAGPNKIAREAARTALQQCLSRDFPTAELRRRYENLVSNDVENLARVQAFGLERLTRIIDYLTYAHEPQLRAVLRHCYDQDLSLNALIRGIYSQLIQLHVAEDQELLQNVTQQCQQLLEELKQQRFRRPYPLELNLI